MPSKRKSKQPPQPATKDDADARSNRARRLHGEIAAMKRLDSPARSLPERESPAAFVHRRMAELTAGKKQRAARKKK